jgi:protein SCO1/2
MRAVHAVVLVLVLGGSARAAEPFDPFGAAGIDGRPGAAVPLDGTFTDQDGRTVSLRRLGRGRPILLVPVQHRCPNICGATLTGVVRAINAQPARAGRDFTLVAFGIDPGEGPGDAAVSAGRLREALAPTPKADVTALVGRAPAVQAVTRALGYRYAWDPRIGQYAHLAAAAVLTPDGRLAAWLYGVQPPPDVLRTALAAASHGGLAGLGERLLLLCYHYDPVSGRYGPLAWTLLRGLGVVVALVLAAFVVASLVRERRRGRARP